MRTNLLLTLVVGLTLCSLAMLEIPELLNLTDDTSNDFSLLVIRQSSPSVVINKTSGVRRTTTPIVWNWSLNPLVVRTLILDSPSPHYDLLHLLCVQRT